MRIINHFLCVGSRILLNVLFEKFIELSEQRFIQQQMTGVLVNVVQILCGQYLRYFSYDGFCNLYDDINEEVFNDSFVVLVKKSMSSKLLGSLQSQFDKAFSLKFDTVWIDPNNCIHIFLDGNEFLSDEDIFIVNCNTKELLIHNKWNNPNLWCTCLPYKLKNKSSPQGHALVMDYIVLIPIRAQNLW